MAVVILCDRWFHHTMPLDSSSTPMPPSLSLPPPLPVEHGTNAAGPRFHRAGLLIALIAILGCIFLAVRRNAETEEEGEPSAASKASGPALSPNVPMDLAVRYGYGLRALLGNTPQWQGELVKELDLSLATLGRTPADRFRVEIVRAWMHDRAPDPAVLQKLLQESPWLLRDHDVLLALRADASSVPMPDWVWFHDRHGWIAKLARDHSLPKDSPDHTQLASEGIRTMVVMAGAGIGMAFGLLGGLALMVYCIVLYRKGRLPVIVPRPSFAWGGAYVEAFAIYLCGWTMVPMVLRTLVPDISRWVPLSIAALVVPLAILWPLLRGVARQEWKQTVGLHTGKGVWREMGIGVLGWFAAWPLIAVGLWIAQVILKMTGGEMSHPIVQPLTEPGMSQLIAVLLAVVWAPLAEEVTFRGLLLPGLSALVRWLAGTLIGAFIFAVIHPQGWAGVAAIMGIAMAASALRLTRGTLIASMTLHAMNNGTLVLLIILAAS